MNLYSTPIGAYDFIIGMEWLETHQALFDCYHKKIHCANDEGEPIVIQQIKCHVYLRFILVMKVWKRLRKGCKICAIEVVSENSDLAPNTKMYFLHNYCKYLMLDRMTLPLPLTLE